MQQAQRNLLVASERRLLNWLGAHLPKWVMPDHPTIVGFAGTLMIVAGYAIRGLDCLLRSLVMLSTGSAIPLMEA